MFNALLRARGWDLILKLNVSKMSKKAKFARKWHPFHGPEKPTLANMGHCKL